VKPHYRRIAIARVKRAGLALLRIQSPIDTAVWALTERGRTTTADELRALKMEAMTLERKLQAIWSRLEADETL
jgi:hypothetical protein